MKIQNILVGIILLLVFALSSVSSFNMNVFGFSLILPNLLNALGSVVLYHFLFDITVSSVILVVAVAMIIVGFLR